MVVREPASTERNGRLREVFLLAGLMGFTAFGGPAAHIAILRREVVERRGWVTESHFLDLLGVTNMIPGPNSTEMVMHVGHERAGWQGLLAAGFGFIFPAASITLALAWLYVRYGTTPSAGALFRGMQPVIVVIVALAVLGLGKTALKRRWLMVPAGLIALGYLAGVNELALLFGGTGLLAAALAMHKRHIPLRRPTLSIATPWLVLSGWHAANEAASYSLARLFLTMLKIGSVLYGSGYVLLAFLRADFVERLGWLTERQLLDAVAIGQMTPGPVFTTATFIGFLVGGWAGAVAATVAIFLPAFVFVWLVNPIIPRMRSNPTLAILLDSVNVVSLGLMGGVTLQLARNAFTDAWSIAIAAVAAAILLRAPISSMWVVVGSGAVGLLAFGAI